jgi:hypothetical protein
MAVYWNLGLFTRTREASEACAAFFQDKRLVLNGLDVPLDVSKSERPDGWLIGVWPQGMSYGSPMGNDPRLTTDDARAEIARVFDEWLLEAPPFAAAFFGGEAFDSFLDGISDLLAPEGFSGLVIDEETWTSLGQPAAAQSVGNGRFAWPRSRIP